MTSSYFLQLRIILRRRFLNLKRSYSMPLIMAIISLIFTVSTGVISILIFKAQNEVKSVKLDLKDLADGDTIIYASDVQNLTDFNITDVLGSISNKKVVKADNVDQLKQKLYDKDAHYCFGAHIIELQNYKYSVNIYYNQSVENNETYRGQIAGGLSELFAKFKQNNKVYNKDIIYGYSPLNSGRTSAALWSIFGPILMSFAITVLGAQYPVILVEDRETYRLYSLQANGLKTSAYFIGNFIFDLICYEVHVIIDWLILLAFKTSVITNNDKAATIIPFILSPIQTLPMVYFISMFFNTKGEASSFILYIVMIIVLIPYFVITLVLHNDVSESVHLAVSLIPSYSIQRALSFAAERSIGGRLKPSDVWKGYLIKHFGVMLASTVLFIVLCLVIYNLLKNFGTKSSKNVNVPKSELDEDVKKIEEEVETGLHNDDAILCKHIDKVYKKSNGEIFKANNDVTLYVKNQETFGVLGANGAGKSTLMSVITGRTQSSGGEIYMFGKKINSTFDAQQFVSICPQFDYHLFPDMTPIEHLEIYGQLKGYNEERLKKEIEEYIELMGLEKHKNKLIRELSGGNARKLSVSLAFLGDAPIVFLDEPTASLDPVARIQAQQLIDIKKQNRTLLLCTHLLSEAERLCDRICIMLHGEVHAIGTHQHLSEKYGKKWKIEFGLIEEKEEIRNKIQKFMERNFPGCELVGTRFTSATYNIPSDGMQLTNAFLLLTKYQNTDLGYAFFTCSMSTLERVFIDLTNTEEVIE